MFVIQYPHNYRIGRRGFTIVEVMLVVAMIGILAGIAIPSYSSYMQRVKEKKTIVDITLISDEIDKFKEDNLALPPNLAALPNIPLLDAWGNPYQYLDFGTVSGVGAMRKDRFMVPINSTYDLYSMGADGRTATPLTAAISRDDIIRANDGQFVGLAVQY
ncbi:MAG: prepilin-type N-terminal cleavage/methylation domain-containing protein [Thermodesulfobacteriota bacterium]|nr:prepilin-type N-terminal cleavage/methylation domain-containing protein [Thermodesulfobacteriota bacterium]